MNDLAVKFTNIRENNGVQKSEILKVKLKQLLHENIEGIQFSRHLRLTEYERVTLKKTSDKAIQILEESSLESDTKNTFDVAKHLKKQILNVESGKFSGALGMMDSWIDMNLNLLLSFCVG